MTTPAKINFKVAQGDDGFPPVAVESLWANPVGDLFKIDSIPFFARDATVEDMIRARSDSNGALWFDCVEFPSQNSLIRVVLFDSDHDAYVSKSLESLGCSIEGMKQFKLIAVSIPASADLTKVKNFLDAEALAGHLDYEEALLR